MSKSKRVCGWAAGFIFLAFTLGSSLADPNSSKVRAVNIGVSEGVVQLSINADKPVEYRSFRLTSPKQQIVFDIYPAVLWGKKEIKPVHQAGIETVRVAQFSSDPDVTRVVVDLERPVGYKTDFFNNHQSLKIALGPEPSKATSAPSMVAADASKAQLKEVNPSPEDKGQKQKSEPTSWHHPKVVQKLIVPERLADHFSLKGAPESQPILIAPSLQAKLSSIFISKANNNNAKASSNKKKAVKPAAAAKTPGYSFSWKNADLTDVVRHLADKMGLNIMIDTSVKGTVTLDLKNVPAAQAMGMILAINGYASRQIGNILVVGPSDKLDKLPATPVAVGPQAIQVIPLENAKPGDLRDTVASEYPEVKVQADSRTNSLLVKGPVDAIRKVKQLVSQLDKPVIIPSAVAPQKEVIQLNYADVKDVLSQVKPLLPSDAVVIADNRLNSIIVIGSQYGIDTLKSFVSAVDVPSPQVMLEMQVLSVNTTATRDLGIEWPGSATTNFTETSAGERGGSIPAPGGTPPTANSLNLNNIGFHAFVRDNIRLTSILHWLVLQNKAKVLGAPRIATINNKEASIQLGDRIPIVYFDPRAGLYQAQYIDVGVILKITPTISPDGSITMHVNPQVSEVTSFVQNFPQLSTRQADTTLRVKNGETIVLGGLLRERSTDAVTKIPLLGDIPILGEFFRHRTTTKEKTDLVISITPTLLANK